MKHLVTQYHALNILDLARGGYLYPFSKYDWVWRTNKGTNQTTVTITVLTDALQLVFPMYGLQASIRGCNSPTRSDPEAGRERGSAVPPVGGGLACCITRTACSFAAGYAASWPMPLNTDHEIRAMAVSPGW